jgi:hypothetical protein
MEAERNAPVPCGDIMPSPKSDLVAACASALRSASMHTTNAGRRLRQGT